MCTSCSDFWGEVPEDPRVPCVPLVSHLVDVWASRAISVRAGCVTLGLLLPLRTFLSDREELFMGVDLTITGDSGGHAWHGVHVRGFWS